MEEAIAIKLPSMSDLVSETDTTIKENNLMVLLNQEPPKSWLREHPTAKIKKNGINVPIPYLPISRVEYLLSRIYKKWYVEIKSIQCIANSTCVVVRLYVVNPVTGETEWNDGVGAAPIQTDAGFAAMDWSKAKAHGVMISAPAAESYAFKDAAEKFGKLFGKDLVRNETIDYTSLLKSNGEEITLEAVQELFEVKESACTAEEIKNYKRIIKNNEKASFKRMMNELKTK